MPVPRAFNFSCGTAAPTFLVYLQMKGRGCDSRQKKQGAPNARPIFLLICFRKPHFLKPVLLSLAAMAARLNTAGTISAIVPGSGMACGPKSLNDRFPTATLLTVLS